MNSFPQIVVGTYEEFVLGYNPRFENKEGTNCKLHQVFATHSHQASVRCIAAHNHLMASSGADEYINIYDMVAMEVTTVINYHNSTVTCLEFTPDGSHLVSANQDGDIVIFRCRDWTLVKLWQQAHKHANGVTSISIHPTGTLLLTTGADNIVRFWNLVKGRQAYATNFSKKCSIGNSLNFGVWSKNGRFYAVGIGNTLEVYKTESAAVVHEIKANTRIASAVFFKKNLICLSFEDGSIEIHSIIKKKLLLKKEAHKNRVKSVTSFSIEMMKKDKNIIKNYIVSIDSKGEIKLWYFKKKGLNCSLLLRGQVDCGCRITCVTKVSCNDIKKESDSVYESVTKEATNEVQDAEIHIVNSCRGDKEKNQKRKRIENAVIQLEQPKSKKVKNGISLSFEKDKTKSLKRKTKAVRQTKKGRKVLSKSLKHCS